MLWTTQCCEAKTTSTFRIIIRNETFLLSLILNRGKRPSNFLLPSSPNHCINTEHPATNWKTFFSRALKSFQFQPPSFQLLRQFSFHSLKAKRIEPFLRRVTPGEIDLEKLVAVNKVVASFLDDKIDTVSATEKLDSIATQKSSFSNSVYVLAFAVASGAVVSFFGGGVNEVFVTGLIGLLVGCLELIARWSPNFGRAYSAVAAISAAFLAVVASKLIPGLSSQIVTLGSLIVLVPGLSVTMAVSELSRQHLASGTSRFMGAILQFLILAFGVSFGRNVAVQLFEPAAANVLAQPQWLFWACLSISPISFAVLFRTRKKDVLLVALTCIIGFFCGKLGREVLGNELGPALGSFSIAVFSNFVSRFFRQPPELTLVPGLMFLVPGSIGFLGLQSFVQHQTLEGIQAAFTVLFVSSALVSGLLLANVFVAPRKW